MRHASVFAVVALSILAACGTTGTNPTRPREARFTAEASTGTPFHLLGFDTTNGGHHAFDDTRVLRARFTFFLLNAEPPVSGTFKGDPSAIEPVSISLRDVDDILLVPLATIAAGSTDEVTVSTQTPPAGPGLTAQPDIRIEVCHQNNPRSHLCSDQDGLQDVPFTANIGDEDSTFLPCGDTRRCGAPAIFYFEQPRNTVSAIISKLVADSNTLLVNLYVNNELRDSASATGGERNARVRIDL